MTNKQSQSIPLPPKFKAVLEEYVQKQHRIAIAVQGAIDAAAALLNVPDGYSIDLDNLDAGFTPRGSAITGVLTEESTPELPEGAGHLV